MKNEKYKYARNKHGAIVDTIDRRSRDILQATRRAIRALNR